VAEPERRLASMPIANSLSLIKDDTVELGRQHHLEKSSNDLHRSRTSVPLKQGVESKEKESRRERESGCCTGRRILNHDVGVKVIVQ
jgi:hypothetical protein